MPTSTPNEHILKHNGMQGKGGGGGDPCGRFHRSCTGSDTEPPSNNRGVNESAHPQLGGKTGGWRIRGLLFFVMERKSNTEPLPGIGRDSESAPSTTNQWAKGGREEQWLP